MDRSIPSFTCSAVLAGLLLVFPAPGSAQVEWLSPADSPEPRVVEVDSPSDGIQPEVPDDRAVTPDELGTPLEVEAIERVRQVAESAVIPLRATYTRDPLVWPSTVEVDGVATLIRPAEGPPVLITALALVDGAERVELVVHGESVPVAVRLDARYGLAVVEAPPTVEAGLTPLPVHAVEADDFVEAFSVGPSTAGAAMGAGESLYGFYQVNSLGVTLGYPLVNRRGELVGVGSHRYPLDPALSLSVPSSALLDFLESLTP